MNIIREEVKDQHEGLVSSYYKKADSFIEPQSKNILVNYFPNRFIHQGIVRPVFEKSRTRVVVKLGMDNISLPLSQIVFFYTENKIVYAFDNIGKKYVTEINLTELEKELDDKIFFRANRQFIININYIKSFRNYERVKLRVKMEPEELNDKYCIVISQEKAPLFKQWIYAA